MRNPGLDPGLVAANLSSVQARHRAAALDVLTHLDRHGGYISYSGGADSTVVAHLAHQAHPGIPIVWFDSGLEFPETRTYIADLSARFGWNLRTICAIPDALSVMAAAGNWTHASDHPDRAAPEPLDLHQVLITDPSRRARAEFGAAELWGLRAAESTGRTRLLTRARGQVRRADGTITYAPLWSWSSRDVSAYLVAHDIPPNPVYSRLRVVGATGRDLRVGMLLDGNHLAFGRAVWVSRGWPQEWARIVDALPRAAEWV